MQRIDGGKLFERARKLQEGVDGPKDEAQAEAIYHDILRHDVGQPLVLHCLGTLYMSQGKYGVGIELLKTAAERMPKFAEAWNNLGLSYRLVDKREEAIEALKRASELKPGDAKMLGNLAACYVNEGQPLKAIAYAEEALRADPNDDSAAWNRTLGLLELGRFKEAWPAHEKRLGGKLESNVASRNYHGPNATTPYWDGKTKGFVVVHGEQGLGDEIMFASCIPDALRTGSKILIECAPRLAMTFARAFPQAIVHGTNKVDGSEWLSIHGKPDFMCGLGSLPKFYRNSAMDFPRTPYLKADPAKTFDILRRVPDRRPLIGIAWQGGVHKTRWHQRSLPLPQLLPILHQDATFVSLNYVPDSVLETAQFQGETGQKIWHLHDITGQEADFDHTVNLMGGLDLVITVCQTALHASGALGIPTWVLVPSKPDWRCGVDGDYMPWYGDHLRMFRQIESQWVPVIDRVAEELRQFLLIYSRRSAA